jgi:hypothetical protein
VPSRAVGEETRMTIVHVECRLFRTVRTRRRAAPRA